MSRQPLAFKRILLKLSGESLVTQDMGLGVDLKACQRIAHSIQKAHFHQVQIGIVIGGGNFFRGQTYCQELNMPRAQADQVGMLATLMNGIILQRALINLNCPTKLLNAFSCGSVAEVFSLNTALKYLENNQIVIFSGGTGNSFFTTDTAASLRALEINADVLLKATKVDGIYDQDPKKNKNAKKYSQLSYNEVLEKNLQVMDATAISLCREHRLPIAVFDMYEDENIKKVIHGQPCGTLVKE